LLVADAVMYRVAAVFTSNVTVLVAADVETEVLSIGATKIGFVTVAVLIAGEVNVSPAIVVTVAPEVMAVEPMVG
jgi:hypothetical protein